VYLRLLWFEPVNDVMPEQAGVGSAGSTVKCWKDTALDFVLESYILTRMHTLWNSNGMAATHSKGVGLREKLKQEAADRTERSHMDVDKSSGIVYEVEFSCGAPARCTSNIPFSFVITERQV
jgi:hypothetical protein